MTLDTRARRAAQGIHRAVEVMEMTTFTKEPRKVERFERFRDRKQRNRRIGAIAVATALAIGALVVVSSGALDRGQGAIPGDRDEVQPTPPSFEAQIGIVTQSETGCVTDSAIGEGHLDGLTVVNETDRRVSFDLAKFVSTDLSYAELEAYVDRERRRGEAGRSSLGLPKGVEVTVRAEVQPGASSAIAEQIPPGRYAILCLRAFDQVSSMRPFALAGPVVFE
jgi:hypothetical protein